jgi:ubiquinone/menaquinone biosynthesis C-methylase UbiE
MLALPFADGCMDACLMMFSVLGMLRSEELRLRALREAARVLRPAGVLVAHVHNRYKHLLRGTASVLHSAVRGLFGGTGEIMRNYRGLPGLFLHLFSRAETRRLLDEAGFAVVREEAIAPDRSGFLKPPASWSADGFLFAGSKKT